MFASRWNSKRVTNKVQQEKFNFLQNCSVYAAETELLKQKEAEHKELKQAKCSS